MDNGTGLASVLAVTRALAPQVAGFRRGLRVMFFSVEEWALTGSAQYVEALGAAERGKIALNVNLDSVAGSPNLAALTQRLWRRRAVRAGRRRGQRPQRPHRAAADDQFRPRQLRPGRHPGAPPGRGLRRSRRPSARRAHARRHARQGGRRANCAPRRCSPPPWSPPPATPIPPKRAQRGGLSGSRRLQELQQQPVDLVRPAPAAPSGRRRRCRWISFMLRAGGLLHALDGARRLVDAPVAPARDEGRGHVDGAAGEDFQLAARPCRRCARDTSSARPGSRCAAYSSL